MPRSDARADGAPLEAREAARLVDGRLEGDPDLLIRGVAPVAQAAEDELGFLAMRRYLDDLPETKARALLVGEDLVDGLSRNDSTPETRIVVEDPHRALPPLLEHFHPPLSPEPGVHPTAVLDPGVELGEGVCIGPYSVLGEGVSVGDGVHVGPHVVMGRGSRVGAGSTLHPQVVLYPGSVLGERVVLHAGVRVGVDGFGYVSVDGDHRKVPQVGSCVIGDDVEIGANSTVDRGSIGHTVVGDGTKMDNLVHLAHNVEVGEKSILVAQVGIAGSTRLGRGVQCGGQAGIIGHAEIGDGARIGAQAGVIGDVEEGETVSGYPARDHRTYLRGMSMVLELPALRRRVRELEKRLDSTAETTADHG